MSKESPKISFYEHFDYCCSKEQWKIIDDLIKANRSAITSPDYLWLHHFEQTERMTDQTDINIATQDRTLRVQRTRYENHLKMARDRIVSLLLKGGFNTSQVDKYFQNGLKDNVDGQSNSLEAYLQILTERIVESGIVYNLTNTRHTENIKTLLEQQENNVRPYFVAIHALDMKDWELGVDDKFDMARFEYMLTLPRASLSDAPILAKYTEILKKSKAAPDSNAPSEVTFQVYESIDRNSSTVNYHPSCEKKTQHYSWSLKKQGTISGIDRVPIITNGIRESLLADAKEIALKIFNKQSDKDNILYSNGYDKLFIIADLENVVDSKGNSVDENKKKKKIAHNSITLLPEKSVPMKLSPTDLSDFRDDINEDIINFYKIAFKLTRITSSNSKETESADNIKEQKEALLTLLQKKRAEILSMFNSMIQDWIMFQNPKSKKDTNAQITFNTSLEQLDIEKLIMYVRAISDRIARYPTWEKATDKILLHNMKEIPNIEEIETEMESTDLEALKQEELETQGLLTSAIKPKPKQEKKV